MTQESSLTQVNKNGRQNPMSHIISHYDNSCTKMKAITKLSMHVWIITSKANESHPTPHYLMQLPHQPQQRPVLKPSTLSKTDASLPF